MSQWMLGVWCWLVIRYSLISSMSNVGRGMSEQRLVERAVDRVFQRYDQNKNNFIDFPQFCKMVDDLNLKISISQPELNFIFEMLDVNGDGRVSKEELVDAFLAVKSPGN